MILNKKSVQSTDDINRIYEVTSSLKIQNWHELALEEYMVRSQETSENLVPKDSEIELLHSYIKIYEGKRTIDFSDQKAVISLTRCILKVIFGIQWTLPLENLCPRIPNRLNYLIWIHRYLIKGNINFQSSKQKENKILGVDIGTGASLIYPILGQTVFGWNFIATDIDQKSINHAENLIKINRLEDSIEIRKSKVNLLTGVIDPLEKINFIMCNPPFFDTLNLALDPLSVMTQNQHNTEGGQYEFFFSLYVESFHFPKIEWFTMMIGLGRNFQEIKKFLKQEYEEYGLLERVKFGKINQSENSRFIVAWKVKKQGNFKQSDESTHRIYNKLERRKI